MLRKLMKHELRATGRVMLPTLGLVLTSAVGANIAVRSLLDSANALMNALGMLLLAVFVMAMAGAMVFSVVLMIRRFYVNLLRDEGYLMMTLPVSVHEHILSKLTVSLIWAAATVITLVLAMIVLVFDLSLIQEIRTGFSALLREVTLGVHFGDRLIADVVMNLAGYSVEFIAIAFAADALLCLEVYAALAVGHSFSSHKWLMTAVAALVMHIGSEILDELLKAFVNLFDLNAVSTWMQTLSETTIVHLWLLVIIVVILLYAGVYYAITAWFLRRRLNLE